MGHCMVQYMGQYMVHCMVHYMVHYIVHCIVHYIGHFIVLLEGAHLQPVEYRCYSPWSIGAAARGAGAGWSTKYRVLQC